MHVKLIARPTHMKIAQIVKKNITSNLPFLVFFFIWTYNELLKLKVCVAFAMITRPISIFYCCVILNSYEWSTYQYEIPSCFLGQLLSLSKVMTHKCIKLLLCLLQKNKIKVKNHIFFFIFSFYIFGYTEDSKQTENNILVIK